MARADRSIEEKLYGAAEGGDVGELARLLDGGEVIPAGAIQSALEGAAYGGKAEAVGYLLGRGADANGFFVPTHESVLHFAASKRPQGGERARVVKLLIAAGADVNKRTLVGATTYCFMRDIRTRGETVLHRAAAYGDVEMIKALVEAGADKSIKDAHGESPLTWGSWHLRDSEVLKLLLYGEFEGTVR